MGLDAATLIALGAMLVSLFGAAIKFIDRKRELNKQQNETIKKQAVSDVERDSFVVRGAEGALLLMEKTMKTTNEEYQKRITELEDEIVDLKCENTGLKLELKDMQTQLNALNDRMRGLK